MALNVGVIGAGRIGKLHAANLVNHIPGLNVVSVVDVVESAAKDLASKLNIPHASSNPADIINDPNIQIVAICSSTDTHSPLIIDAANAGKHIFCEKPIDFDLGRIDAALKAVAKAGVKLQIGFNRRFDPNFARLRQAVVNKEIGELHTFHIISRDPAPPPIEYIKVSGGLFFDMTIHDFDMARFLVGADCVEIYAKSAVKVDPAIGAAGDIDTAMLTLTFENGVFGTIENSRQAVYGYDQRAEVFGSGGAASSQNHYANYVNLSTAQSVYTGSLPLHFFLERYTQSFIAEMVAFAEAITEDKPVLVGGEDGLKPVLMAMAAKKSMQENRPVKISEIG